MLCGLTSDVILFKNTYMAYWPASYQQSSMQNRNGIVKACTIQELNSSYIKLVIFCTVLDRYPLTNPVSIMPSLWENICITP